jgi:hypothetical protein
MAFQLHLLRRLRVLILCLFMALFLSSCGLVPAKDSGASVSSQSSSSSTTLTGVGGPPSAFVSGFYAFATAPGMCIQCHGSTQIPLFAVSDTSTACNNLLPYINMTEPAASILAAYAGNSHCGISSVCGSNTATVTAQIQAWATAPTSLLRCRSLALCRRQLFRPVRS